MGDVVTVAQPHLDVHPRLLTMAGLPRLLRDGSLSLVPGELILHALGADLSPD